MHRELGNGKVLLDQALMPSGRTILPTFDKVLVRKDEAPEKVGVIIVPPSYRDQQPVTTGTVVATGPETVYVTPGMYVVVSQYSGSNVKVDGVGYTVLREQDIHVVIESGGGSS